jgi:hypothetical protein
LINSLAATIVRAGAKLVHRADTEVNYVNRIDFDPNLEKKVMIMSDVACSHLNNITAIKNAKGRECEECVKIAARWVHLRTCQECSATLCCDSSPNRHATSHARASGHPVIASAEDGERWLYCYQDDAFAEY